MIVDVILGLKLLMSSHPPWLKHRCLSPTSTPAIPSVWGASRNQTKLFQRAETGNGEPRCGQWPLCGFAHAAPPKYHILQMTLGQNIDLFFAWMVKRKTSPVDFHDIFS